MTVLTIERMTVEDRHVEALVRVEREFLRTSACPGVPDRALALLPGLARHTCENDAGKRFADEMRDTETAHLLEHIACEIMSLSGSPRTLHAETAWDFAADGPGVFRVRLQYDNDLVAMGAIKAGAEVVEWLLGEGGERPDVAAVVRSLRGLRP